MKDFTSLMKIDYGTGKVIFDKEKTWVRTKTL